MTCGQVSSLEAFGALRSDLTYLRINQKAPPGLWLAPVVGVVVIGTLLLDQIPILLSSGDVETHL